MVIAAKCGIYTDSRNNDSNGNNMKRCDLHIHTVASVSDRTFTFDKDVLVDYVKKTGLDVIAITNHNVFDYMQFNEIQIELSNTIDELVLEHERLNIIRQVWCLIAKSHLYCIDDVKTAISDDTLRSNILADCGVPARIEKRVRQPIYWSLLCDYYWFYRYFYNS